MGAALRKLVIADASPLIGFAAAKCFDLLRELFGTIVVTRTVLDEVLAGGRRAGASELSGALREGWIRAAPTPYGTWRFSELDIGEASALALALERGDALVLMDDELGRVRAAANGIETLGTPQALLLAKRAGLIGDVRSYLERLGASGFIVPDGVASAVLAEAGEA
jgi:predicted nucleic acid-binding protein